MSFIKRMFSALKGVFVPGGSLECQNVKEDFHSSENTGSPNSLFISVPLYVTHRVWQKTENIIICLRRTGWIFKPENTIRFWKTITFIASDVCTAILPVKVLGRLMAPFERFSVPLCPSLCLLYILYKIAINRPGNLTGSIQKTSRGEESVFSGFKIQPFLPIWFASLGHLWWKQWKHFICCVDKNNLRLEVNKHMHFC